MLKIDVFGPKIRVLPKYFCATQRSPRGTGASRYGDTPVKHQPPGWARVFSVCKSLLTVTHFRYATFAPSLKRPTYRCPPWIGAPRDYPNNRTPRPPPWIVTSRRCVAVQKRFANGKSRVHRGDWCCAGLSLYRGSLVLPGGSLRRAKILRPTTIFRLKNMEILKNLEKS